MHLEIKLVKLGKLHVAATVMGGIQIRGRSAPEPEDAVRNLLWKLAGQDGDDDARLAVALAVNGVDLQGELEAIGDGRAE